MTPGAIAAHEPTAQRERSQAAYQSDGRGEIGHGEHHASPLGSSAVGSPSATHSFFGFDDQLSALELAALTGDVAVQMLDLPGRGVRLWPPPF
jgi:hypothetical protein